MKSHRDEILTKPQCYLTSKSHRDDLYDQAHRRQPSAKKYMKSRRDEILTKPQCYLASKSHRDDLYDPSSRQQPSAKKYTKSHRDVIPTITPPSKQRHPLDQSDVETLHKFSTKRLVTNQQHVSIRRCLPFDLNLRYQLKQESQ